MVPFKRWGRAPRISAGALLFGGKSSGAVAFIPDIHIMHRAVQAITRQCAARSLDFYGLGGVFV